MIRYALTAFEVLAGWLILSGCNDKNYRLQLLSQTRTGIDFVNAIIENDSINQLDLENIYNGGGVGIGDFNNDALPDLFFTGNLVSNRLYLNRGKMKFEDITAQAGTTGEGRWCSGAALVDINNDGWLDIHVSATLKNNSSDRQNLLYVHQGLNKSGLPEFREMAHEYGLADESHTTQAVFFDYDNDGDLDVYLVVNEIDERISPYLYRPVMKNGQNPSTGKLYRNDFNEQLNHPVYTDVSKTAGIMTEGYSHMASIVDINHDGWKDIFVSNDFLTNDLLWINNCDGTFTDRAKEYFKHTSANSMGNEVNDVNNDALPDFLTLDMNPEDNYRRKMMLLPNQYQVYQNTERYGYTYQYVRNTLQVNQGRGLLEQDSAGLPVFSETGYYSGFHATDWSWTPVVTDLDNDGYRDVFITNGFPRDITDHDFAVFRNMAHKVASKGQILSQIPEVKLHNYVFQNKGDLRFSDVSEAWGITVPSFSNGAAYADLDLDGDMDIVINNINDPASVYKNLSRELNPESSNYIQFSFDGSAKNRQGFGAQVTIYFDGTLQWWENNPYRGYLSTILPVAHFGLGTEQLVDSVIVQWSGGLSQTLYNLPANRQINLKQSDAHEITRTKPEKAPSNRVFTEITRKAGIHFTHPEEDFIDFNIQKLLPHKFSEYGPALAAADLNGDGLDDMVSGGSTGNSAMLFFQSASGTFKMKPLITNADKITKPEEDTGILIFDADGDLDNDLYIVSGGYEYPPGSENYTDRLYLNKGKGQFVLAADALPENNSSKFCIRAADYDRDGDLDLFISGRVEPWHYPKPVSSFLYRNDSKPDLIRFTDVTAELAPSLDKIGMVCDALFTDYNNDGWVDLVLAGEWMPITFLQNKNGRFSDQTALSGLKSKTGWWNSIVAGDFDQDGDMDYVLGNLGENSFYKASETHPASVYAADFDNNGSFDAFPAVFLPASQENQALYEFPAHSRDDAVKQMIGMRVRFQNYKSYAVAAINQVLPAEGLQQALVLQATTFQSAVCLNEGNGRFSPHPLPVQAQLSILNGMLVDDFTGDGNLDILAIGNDYGTEVSVGRYDALNGLLLEGDGSGGFQALTIAQSGFYVPGNGKGLSGLRGAGGEYLVVASENRGPLRLFLHKSADIAFSPNTDETYAILELLNGKKRKIEFFSGSSFLSQSVPMFLVNSKISSARFYNCRNEQTRMESFNN